MKAPKVPGFDKLQVAWIARADLNPAPYNPRRISEKERGDLRTSLERFGFVEPLVVNAHPQRKNVIIGGHQRFNLAADLAIDPVPVVFVTLDEQAERELNLRLNRNHGSWDWELLRGYDLESLRDVGFDDRELAANLENLGGGRRGNPQRGRDPGEGTEARQLRRPLAARQAPAVLWGFVR